MIQLSEHDPSSPKQIERTKQAIAIKEVSSLLVLLDSFGLSAKQLERMSYDGSSFLEIHALASRGVESSVAARE